MKILVNFLVGCILMVSQSNQIQFRPIDQQSNYQIKKNAFNKVTQDQ